MSSSLEKARWVLILLCGVLLLSGLYLVLSPFLTVFAWSIIVVFTTWPLYAQLSAQFPKRPNLSALIMTLVMSLILLGVLIPILRAVSFEFESAIKNVDTLIEESRFERLMASTEKIPYLGQDLSEALRNLKAGGFDQSIIDNRNQLLGVVTVAAKGILEFFLKFILFIFVTYFFFRDGQEIGTQLRRGLVRLGGPRFDNLLSAAKQTLSATVYGMLLTAVAQGSLAGIGYSVAGAPVPLVFAVLTTLLSLVPFGPPLVYIPLCLLLAANGADWWIVTGLFLYCVLVVSSIDNVLRPIFIGQRTKLSILPIFVGVIGGTITFGLIGVFIGPIIIALTKALWDEWISNQPRNSTAQAAVR